MPLDHPYKKLPVPSDALFELKPSPGKGWGAFAKRRISKGTAILIEKPLFVIHKSSLEITEQDVWMAFKKLAFADKEKFLRLGDNGSGPFSSLLEAMAQNTFDVYTKGSNLPAYGLFVLLSRFNHSCVPNSKIPTSVEESDRETLTIFARRDIAVGEEITFCYIPELSMRTREERRQLLPFTCNCEACHEGTLFQQASDMRRALIRGLRYLTLGEDITSQRQDSTLPFLIDSELKKAAEELTIPSSSKLVYQLLTMVLLEEEGLMDDFVVERALPGIQLVSEGFATESNAKLAKLAMAQGSWLEKFGVAARLYGREDAADADIAIMIRAMHGLGLKN